MVHTFHPSERSMTLNKQIYGLGNNLQYIVYVYGSCHMCDRLFLGTIILMQPLRNQGLIFSCRWNYLVNLNQGYKYDLGHMKQERTKNNNY